MGDHGLRAGAGRRLCRVLRGAAGAMPAGAEGPDAAGSGLAAGNLLHRLEQCVRPRRAWRQARPCWCRAARSGIGVTAIQLATALGHRVFATAGSDDKCRACEELGAERAHQLPRPRISSPSSRQPTGGKGVDVILDMVGGDYVAREIDCLADDGRIALIALLGGAKADRRPGPGAAPAPDASPVRPCVRARWPSRRRSRAQLREHVWPLLDSGHASSR